MSRKIEAKSNKHISVEIFLFFPQYFDARDRDEVVKKLKILKLYERLHLQKNILERLTI